MARVFRREGREHCYPTTILLLLTHTPLHLHQVPHRWAGYRLPACLPGTEHVCPTPRYRLFGDVLLSSCRFCNSCWYISISFAIILSIAISLLSIAINSPLHHEHLPAQIVRSRHVWHLADGGVEGIAIGVIMATTRYY